MRGILSLSTGSVFLNYCIKPALTHAKMINKTIPLIPVRYYLRLIELIAARNISTQALCDELNIDIGKFLAEPDLKVSIEKVEKFVQYCLKYPANRDLAFELGRSLHLSSHSLVGYAILTCDTIEHALRLVTRYFSLIMPSFKAFIHYNPHNQMELTIEPELLLEPLTLNFHIEAIAVALQNNINELISQQLASYHIFLSIPEPLHVHKFNQLTSAKFHFNSLHKPGIKLILSQSLLEHKLPLADEMTLKAVERRCQEQMKEITYGQDFPEWIERVLMNAYQMPTLAECADLLHVSTKTLQRQLRKKNTDFNVIKKKVITLRAKQRLAHCSDSITQIAHELGYSSSSNFARAFKALVGISPEGYRANCNKS